MGELKYLTHNARIDAGFADVASTALSMAHSRVCDSSVHRFLQDSLPNLNDYPVYLGQPPSYVSSQKSANGYLWGASTYTGALNAEQVKKNADSRFLKENDFSLLLEGQQWSPLGQQQLRP